MKILNENGAPDVRTYTLHGDGLRAVICSYGAAIVGIAVKKDGVFREVCLGFDDVTERENSGTYSGATIGRVSGRIAGARFVVDGVNYSVSANENGNCLHGGAEGFNRKNFKGELSGNRLKLTAVSDDGDMGFPGKLTLEVEYLLEGNTLSVTYTAISDKDTLWAPTCHAYFNLEGCGSENCFGNMLKINAKSYAEVGGGMIPTGRLLPAENTPFDFSDFRAIGERIDADDVQLKIAGGYDHTYICKGAALAAEAYGPHSGIRLAVYSDMPAIQFYSGNYMRGTACDVKLHPYSGFALEPQFVPNAVNMQGFDVPLLRAGEKKTHYIKYVFA